MFILSTGRWNYCPFILGLYTCSHLYSRTQNNAQTHFSKAEFILGSHQMKPCINITFMIAKSHIFSCKMREYRPSINVFKNKLIHWLLAEKYNSKKNSSFQKYYYLKRFYNSVGGEPYPHIDQFNLDLGQPPPPLFCFSFVYDFVMYYMYVVFFCVHLLFL